MEKIFIRTYGCQMNENDSEIIRSILKEAGFVFVNKEDQADVILLNTCAVRENAVRKVYAAVNDIRHRRSGRPVFIGILGCIPTHAKEDILHHKHVSVDFIAGPDSYRRLPGIITEAIRSRAKLSDLEFSKEENYDQIIPARQKGVNAWVTVMRGCDNFCTFCVVPYARGRERSRRPQTILDEAQKAIEQGYPQVTLLGQNVNSYRYGDLDFSGLLERVSGIKHLKRIRFVAPHPKDFPPKLLEVMAGHDNICKHIHLPLQAGNARVLKLMNRRYTQNDYLKLADRIRSILPEVTLTTDIIVGFPTETNREFRDTVKVMKKVQFNAAFIFKYSERQGTLAAKKYKDDVPAIKKKERIVYLNELQKEISVKKHRALIGRTLEILIEAETTARSANQVQGRTDGNTLVVIPKNGYRLGQFIPVRILDATANVLKGVPA